MDESLLATSVNPTEVKEEEEEEDDFFNWSGTPDSNLLEETNSKEEKTNNIDEIDDGILNNKSESRLIVEQSDAENYNKNALEGKFDTKKHFWFTNIEYAPEHVRGKKSWRGSGGDFLRFIDRAGISFAQQFVNTLQDVGRQDMPAYMSELLTGDVVSSTKLSASAIQKALKNRSLYTLFNELGFTKEGGDNRMSMADAIFSTGKVNNFERFDQLTGGERLQGKHYGLFGMPSLVEMSGGFPERNTGRPVADFTTNLFGDATPFFATTAAIMTSPTPMDDVALVGNTYRTVKASSPAIRNMVGFLSKRTPNLLKRFGKWAVKNAVGGSRAGFTAETFLGDPYYTGMDDVLPDYFKSVNKADDSFIEAKMKSLIVTEVFLAPMLGIGFGGVGKGVGKTLDVGYKGVVKPAFNYVNPFDKNGSVKAFMSPAELGDRASAQFAETQKKVNSFKGKNRFDLAYKSVKNQVEEISDDVEKMLIEPAVDYVMNTSMVKKITEEMGFVYKSIDENAARIDELKLKQTGKTVDDLVIENQERLITEQQNLNLKKDGVRDEIRKKNVEGRTKSEQFNKDQQEIAKLTDEIKKLEAQNEKFKKEMIKRVEKAAKSEKELQEAMIVNNQVRPRETIQKHEAIGISAANKPSSVLQIQRLDPEDIEVRPDIFQVKESGKFNKNGVSGSLADEKEFDGRFSGVLSVWKDTNGELGTPDKIYVIDGHNRLDLAKRSGVKEVNVQVIQAPNKNEAIVEAAMININSHNYSQKGSIAPIDVAKIIKSNGAQKLANSGLNVNQRLVKEGMRLARIPQFMFDKLMGGTLSMDKALAYGSQPLDPIVIGDVFQSLEKERPSILMIEVTMKMAGTAETAVEQGTITGMGAFMQSSNFKQLRAIRVAIEKNIKDSIKNLKTVSTEKAAKNIESKVKGNKIKYDENRKVLEEALFMVDKLDAAAMSGGRVQKIIKELAAEVKGSNANKLVKDNIDRIKEAIELDDAPLLDMDQGVRMMQEADRVKNKKLEALENEDQTLKLTEDEAKILKEDVSIKENLKDVDEDNQANIFDQLQTKGKVTNNPSAIKGEALPLNVTNPAARVFPDIFEGTDREVLEYATDNVNRFQGKGKLMGYEKMSNFELEEAITRTKRYVLSDRQLKNIAQKSKKYDIEEAKWKKMNDELQDFWKRYDKAKAGYNGLTINGKPASEASVDKFVDEVLAQEKKYQNLSDGRLWKHEDHMKLVAEMQKRKSNPDFYNRKEEKIAVNTKAQKEKEIKELHKTIEFQKDRGDYETERGFPLANPSDINDFSFSNYGSLLGRLGLVDDKGKQFSQFYFGKPSPRYNDLTLTFENDVDTAIYIVGKQLATASKQSKSHYKYVELLADLNISNDQILTRYREIIDILKTGDDYIVSPENYWASKLIRSLDDLEVGLNDINGKYDFSVDPEEIISGRVNEAKKKLDKKINAEYKEVTDAKYQDPLDDGMVEHYEILEKGGDLADDEFYFSLTDYSADQLSGLMKHVRDIFDVELKVVSDPIKTKHNAKSAKLYGVPVGTEFQARGFYHPNQDPTKDLLIVSMIAGQDMARFSKMVQTAFHEGTHRLFNRFYTKSEHAILKSSQKDIRQLAAMVKPLMADRFLGINGAKPIGLEEVVTTAASGYLRYKDLYEKSTGKWGQIFDKFGEMVERVKNFLTFKGFRSWRDIFDDSFSGRIRARGMTPEGAKFKAKVDSPLFEVDANELSNLFNDNLEALVDGQISLEEMMSNVRRPLVNRKFRTKGTKFYVETDKKAMIAANKTVNEVLNKINDELQRGVKNNYSPDITEVPNIPTTNKEQIAKLAVETIEQIEGDVDEVLKLHKAALQGDFFAQKDLVSIAAVRMMIDGSNEVLQLAAQNFKMNNTPQNGQILFAAFEDAAKLNNAYASYGRITGQRLSNMHQQVQVKGLNNLETTVELMSRDRGVTLQGETKSIKDAMDNGIKATDQGLGDGAYFTGNEVPSGQIASETVGGNLKDATILDLDEANYSLAELLRDMGVKFNMSWDGKKTLTKTQKQAVQDFISKYGVDGIRIKGKDLGLDGDVIYVPDTNKANQMIGSKAEIIPEAERPIQYSEKSFSAALAEGENVFKRLLPEKDYNSIMEGKPTPAAMEVLRVMADMNPFLTEEIQGKKIMKFLNVQLGKIEDGALNGSGLAESFKMAIFGGFTTMYKVLFGSGQRATLLPYYRGVGNFVNSKILKRSAMTDNAKRLADWRMGTQFLNAHVMSLARIHHAFYLGGMAFLEDTSFSNINKKAFLGDIKSKRFKNFEPVYGDEGGRQMAFGDYKLKEKPKPDAWYLDPENATIERIFMHRIKAIPTLPSRFFSMLDTFMATGPMMTQETIRHANNMYTELLAKGVDINLKSTREYVMNKARDMVMESRKDVEMASGRVVKGGFFDSENARNIADYINFTDDIAVGGNKRTLEAARLRALEQGITDPMEMLEFTNAYMKLDDTNSSVANTNRANTLLGDYMSEQSNNANIGGIPYTGFIRPTGQGAINMVPKAIDNAVKENPVLGVGFPTNKTPVNIFKSVLRHMPAMNQFVDSYWRDINSEDILMRETAIGDVAMGTMGIGFGLALQATGVIKVNGPTNYNQRKRLSMSDQKVPVFSIQFRLKNGTYSKAYSLEPTDVIGQLLVLSSEYIRILNQMPIEGYTTVKNQYPMYAQTDIGEYENIKSIQDAFNIAGYHVVKHFKAFLMAAGSTAGGIYERGYFSNIQNLQRIIEEYSKQESDNNNFSTGNRGPLPNYLRRLLKGYFPTQIGRDIRVGIDNRKTVYGDSDTGILPIDFGINTIRDIAKDSPFFSKLFEGEVDEIFGDVKTYDTPYDWNSLPTHRRILHSVLNPMNMFRPTQTRDFGSYATVYNELNRLHGVGNSPRFIPRNIFSKYGVRLDDKEYNNFKKFFTSRENEADYFKIGVKMTVSEALEYLFTEDAGYKGLRDYDPSKVKKGQKPESISSFTKLEKLVRVEELIKAYRDQAKEKYEVILGSKEQVDNAQKIIKGKKTAQLAKDSMPVYGSGVNLNEWREIINS